MSGILFFIFASCHPLNEQKQHCYRIGHLFYWIVLQMTYNVRKFGIVEIFIIIIIYYVWTD